MPYSGSHYLAIGCLALMLGGPVHASDRAEIMNGVDRVISSSGPVLTFVGDDGAVIAILPAPQQPPRFRHLDVIRTLEASGYIIISVRETLLNRIRIQARNDMHLREIVISRSTGNILRDVALETYGDRDGR